MFNAARYLPHVLPPLRDLPDDWELILVDDGSSDDSAALAAQLLPRARVVRLACRQGAAAARNRALEVTAGPVVVFLDADVQATAATLGRLVAYLFERPEVAAVFG
ncbi:MAG TPA: glycosyltransferase family 2 protein, partial [Candidatus Xenobia bacterium]